MNYDNQHEFDEPDDYWPMDDIGKDERMWAMFCHLSSFAHIFGPLIIWLIKREEMPLVDDQGREALNFQISITIYALICVPFMFVLIGIPMLFALAIFNIVVTIMAAIKANEGYEYRYPLCIRFLS
jgi:uncharacterized Tic20 family protein